MSDVFSRPECIFNYCPHPENCKESCLAPSGPSHVKGTIEHPAVPGPKENQMDGLLMKYFVLKPAGNDRYAAASRRAMRAYADFIREENVVLSDELRDWAGREGAEAHMARMEGSDEG